MFTGIIEGLGTIKALTRSRGGARMSIGADFPLEGVKLGDSIAVNGACLTVVDFKNNIFDVDVAPETLSRTTLGDIKVGARVNLEQALRFGDRLGGHLVSGHVDGIGVVSSKRSASTATLFAVDLDEALSRHIVEKGSVALDGISLTVNVCERRSFEVSIIPHTAKMTTMGLRGVGDAVNIETDIIGKYVEQFTQPFVKGKGQAASNPSAVDDSLLSKLGYK